MKIIRFYRQNMIDRLLFQVETEIIRYPYFRAGKEETGRICKDGWGEDSGSSGYGCTIPVPESGRWNIGCPFKPAYFFDWRNFYCAWRIDGGKSRYLNGSIEKNRSASRKSIYTAAPIPPTMVNILEIIDSVFVLRILHI